MHKSGGEGACIDFATVMKNMHDELRHGNYTIDDLEGSEEEGWVALGERYSAVEVWVEGS
jgi:hypothetical protein